MNLGELEDRVSAEEQLLEVLGDKNEEEDAKVMLKKGQHVCCFDKSRPCRPNYSHLPAWPKFAC